MVVDAGGGGMLGGPEHVSSESDVIVVVTGTGLPELARARSWLSRIVERASGEVRLVVAGRVRPYSASEVTKAVGVPVAGEVAWDPDAARLWSHGEPQRRFGRSALARSVTALGESLRDLAPRANVESDRWTGVER